MSVVYLDTDISSGPYPVPIGFCKSKKDWDKEMKRLEMDVPFVDTTDHCQTLIHPNGAIRCIVCLPRVHNYDELHSQVEALAHEATHVWQRVADYIHETEPAREQEAYMIGWITSFLFKQAFGVYKSLKVR